MRTSTMPNETSSGAQLRDRILEELQGDAGVFMPAEITRGIYHRISIENGFLTKLHTFRGKNCSSTYMFDICGAATTNRDGAIEIRLEDFVCLEREIIAPPAFFVATPRSDSPVHLTFGINVVDDATGIARIRIKVWAWNVGGEPVANVPFHWRCCVPFEIGGID
jgi:hypothetical protein